MRRQFGALILVLGLILGLAGPGSAGEMMTDHFDGQPETRWAFVADTVMGGVSTGEVTFGRDGDVTYARMTGQVSTENRGGFIQFRRALPARLAEDVRGVRLVVRGNGEHYFIHLRTSETVLPWQYYQAGFDTSDEWRELRLPFDAFKASGRMLRATPRAGAVTSVGVVAYGRDHAARIDVREIGFY